MKWKEVALAAEELLIVLNGIEIRFSYQQAAPSALLIVLNGIEIACTTLATG